MNYLKQKRNSEQPATLKESNQQLYQNIIQPITRLLSWGTQILRYYVKTSTLGFHAFISENQIEVSCKPFLLVAIYSSF